MARFKVVLTAKLIGWLLKFKWFHNLYHDVALHRYMKKMKER